MPAFLGEYRIAFGLSLDYDKIGYWMETSPSIVKQIEAILSAHKTPPRVLRKDRSQLSSGEQKSLVLRSEHYLIDSPGLDLLTKLLAGLDSAEAKKLFWDVLKEKVRHPLAPWFFISQRKLVHLLEQALDQLESGPLDQQLIMATAEALKVEHARYTVQDLEELGNLIGILMTQSQLSGDERSIEARQSGEIDIAPNYMRTMRAKRDVYKALGTLREVTQGALYQRLEGMLEQS